MYKEKKRIAKQVDTNKKLGQLDMTKKKKKTVVYMYIFLLDSSNISWFTEGGKRREKKKSNEMKKGKKTKCYRSTPAHRDSHMTTCAESKASLHGGVAEQI